MSGKDGVLYGTTSGAGGGTAFALTAPAVLSYAWTETVLHRFTGASAGGEPLGGLIVDDHGNLYGTTVSEGSAGYGVVFELIRPASPGGAWTYSILYSFGSQTTTDSVPSPSFSARWRDLRRNDFRRKRSLIGRHRLSVSALADTWSETVLHSFVGYPSDGRTPAVLAGSNGKLYGTTGTVFELIPPAAAGAPWTETILHDFGSTATAEAPLP